MRELTQMKKIITFSFLLLFTVVSFGHPSSSSLYFLAPETVAKKWEPIQELPANILYKDQEDYFDFDPSDTKTRSVLKDFRYDLVRIALSDNKLSVELDPTTRKIIRFNSSYIRAMFREKIFEGLYNLLDSLQAKMKGIEYTRKGQLQFAQAHKAKIEAWIQENLVTLQTILPLIVELPTDNAGYARNEAMNSQTSRKKRRDYFSVYSHAWPPNGETDYHGHGGALAFTAAVTPGFIETTLTPEKNLPRHWDNQVLKLNVSETPLPPGVAGVLTRGEGSNHKISNRSEQIAIMIELYIWKDRTTRLKRVNNSIPVEGTEDQFLVLDVPVSGMPYKIADRLANYEEKSNVEPETFLSQMEALFDLETEDQLFRSDVLGIFTTENKALISLEQIRAYVQKHSPNIIEVHFSDNGSDKIAYLLQPAQSTPTPLTSPSLEIAKAL